MSQDKDVHVKFKPETTPRDEVDELFTDLHRGRGVVEGDYEITERGGKIHARFNVDQDELETDPRNFLFATFTAYGEVAWHNFD